MTKPRRVVFFLTTALTVLPINNVALVKAAPVSMRVPPRQTSALAPTAVSAPVPGVGAYVDVAKTYPTPLAPARGTAPTPKLPDLSNVSRIFERQNGEQQNIVLIDPKAQAHIVLENYSDHAAKRMVTIAQPSGNVGGGMWWSSESATSLAASEAKLVNDGQLTGTQIVVSANASGSVTFEPPVLDSVRALRDRATNGYDDRQALRQEMAGKLGLPQAAIKSRIVAQSATTIVFERESLARRPDGSPVHIHRMVVEAMPGTTLSVDADNHVRMTSAGKPQVKVAYLTDLPPLTPYAPLDLLNGPAKTQMKKDIARAEAGLMAPEELETLKAAIGALEDLQSLVFQEKALAGGWRFLTYFGRDTIQTMQMLRPLLDPVVVERVLEAALARRSKSGQVAHEESLVDEAAHERLMDAKKSGATSIDLQCIEDPIYDYKMIDTEYMLVSVLYEHLLDPNYDAAKRSAFITRNRNALADVIGSITKHSNVDDIDAVLTHIASKTRPFAQDPTNPRKLVRFNEGEPVGDWRDSNPGNAGGDTPGSVDPELIPTSLAKGAKLADFLGLPQGETLRTQAEVWEKRAREHFTITLSQPEMRDRLRVWKKDFATKDEVAHFGSRTIDPYVHVDDFIAGSPLTGRLAKGITFPAIALDAKGNKIPVMTSDALFGLLGSEARPQTVRTICTLLTTPYPLGLATEAGLLITNAAFSGDKKLYDLMGPGRYHGTVIWTWLEALGIAALSHQAKMCRAQGFAEEASIADDTVRILKILAKTGGKLQTSELYAYGFKNGDIVPQALVGKKDEPYDSWPGNATQLWATALPLLVWGHARKLT